MKRSLILLISLQSFFFGLYAQQTEQRLKTTTSPYGYLQYLPEDYGRDSMALVVFLHGFGEAGNGTTDLYKVANTGLPSLLKNNRLPYVSQSFVVLSPQIGSKYFSPATLEKFIQYAIVTYKIDPSKIYLTGLSGGATSGYNYIRLYQTCAAAVLISGYGNRKDICLTQACKTPLWVFHGSQDQTITYPGSLLFAKRYNEYSPEEKAKATLYNGVGHDAWTRTYNLSGIGSGLVSTSLEGKPFSLNLYDESVYEWLLRHKK
jgi:predicted peptidase